MYSNKSWIKTNNSNKNIEFDLKIATSIKSEIQKELVFWTLVNNKFSTQLKIFELLDDEHQLFADNISGKNFPMVFDCSDFQKFLKQNFSLNNINSSNEAKNWQELAKSKDNVELAYQLANSIKDKIQYELIYWFLINDRFSIKKKLYNFLTKENQKVADALFNNGELSHKDLKDYMQSFKNTPSIEAKKAIVILAKQEIPHSIIYFSSKTALIYAKKTGIGPIEAYGQLHPFYRNLPHPKLGLCVNIELQINQYNTLDKNKLRHTFKKYSKVWWQDKEPLLLKLFEGKKVIYDLTKGSFEAFKKEIESQPIRIKFINKTCI